MIKTVKIKKDDKLLYELLGERTLEFTDGINVIWGANGIGKSVLSKVIAHYCFTEKGWTNWQFGPVGGVNYLFSNEDMPFVDRIEDSSKLGSIDIDWSGTPMYFLPFDHIMDKAQMFNEVQGGNEAIDSYMGMISRMFTKPSAGQTSIGYINKLLDLQVPDLLQDSGRSMNDVWQKQFDGFQEYLRGKKPGRKPILLLDEPDKSLSFKNQGAIHHQILPTLAEKYQIICISHSIFALNKKEWPVNLIDLDGSSGEVRDYITRSFHPSSNKPSNSSTAPSTDELKHSNRFDRVTAVIDDVIRDNSWTDWSIVICKGDPLDNKFFTDLHIDANRDDWTCEDAKDAATAQEIKRFYTEKGMKGVDGDNESTDTVVFVFRKSTPRKRKYSK